MRIHKRCGCHLIAQTKPWRKKNNRQPIAKAKTSPRTRAKKLAFPHNLLNSRPLHIRRVQRLQISPPLWRRLKRQLQGQEDDNGRDGQANVQAGGSDVVEAHPPPAILVLDIFVKQPAHCAPGKVVERGCGRQVAGAGEDDRRGEVAEVASRPRPGGEVDEDGSKGANDPKVKEAGIDLTRAEDTAWPDESPDNAGVEEDAGLRAGEVTALVPGADVGDCAKGPVHDADLHEAGPDGGDDLRHEHGSRGNFHVVAELEVLDERYSLAHGYVPVCFEEHHGNGAAGLHVANDEFCGWVRLIITLLLTIKPWQGQDFQNENRR